MDDLVLVKLFLEVEESLQAAFNAPKTALESLETGYKY